MKEVVCEIKKKKEFSKLPDSVVERVAQIAKGDVKKARTLLRKYFGVFLTNKVMKLKDESVLISHISSKNRDYREFYNKIFECQGGEIKSVIDIGCGVNGFSFPFLKDVLGDVNYLGVEAVGQIVDNMNFYFKENNFNAKVICGDVFYFNNIKQKVSEMDPPRVFLLLQVLDALESFERNSSKRFLLELDMNLSKEDLVVITMPMGSISGRKKFEVKRYWLENFLKDNFTLEKDFEIGNERVFVVRKR